MTSSYPALIGVALMSLVMFSCNEPAQAADKLPKPAKDVAPTTQPSETATAVFGGGCFWASEEAFDQLEGVTDVVSGYAGGTAETANYEDSHNSAHAEVVEVKYDASKITYGKLLHALFTFIDATQVDGQGPDRGPGYRSSIFYANDEQKQLAEAYIKQLTDAKLFNKPIATKIEKLDKFYVAEDYHQNYLKNPAHLDRGYVRNVSLKKVEKVREAFKGELKSDTKK